MIRRSRLLRLCFKNQSVVHAVASPSPAARGPSRILPLIISICLFQVLLSGSTISLAGDLASSLVVEATKRKLKKSEVSFSFRLPDGTVLEHLPKEPRAPASCMKLVVTAASLDLLGPDHNFETHLKTVGKLNEGVLEGDLVVVGGGDPAICGRENPADPLWELRPWVDLIRTKGIERIRGRILADVRYLSGEGVHPDWPVDQLSRWYCAPSGALNLNDNCIDLLIGPVVDGEVQIQVRPSQPLLGLTNKLVPCLKKKDHLYRIDRKGNGWEIVVSGKFLSTSSVRTEWVAVPDPADNFVSIFLQLLRDSGIKIDGEVLSSSDQALLLNTIRHTLISRLPVMMKNSQNLYADSVFRVLSKVRGGDGSFQSAANELEDWIESRILPDTANVSVRDGSGLSRENRISARILRKVVEVALASSWRDPFFDSLPVSGVDGTLEKRMTTSPLQGKVRAKTGTIRGAVSLTGVLDSAQGPIPFSLLYHGRSGRTGAARQWQDRALSHVFKAFGSPVPNQE